MKREDSLVTSVESMSAKNADAFLVFKNLMGIVQPETPSMIVAGATLCAA